MRVFGSGSNPRKAVKLACVALMLGGILGFGLDSFGLLPLPQMRIQWVVPALRASDYAPDASVDPGEETLLIYIGASTCGWSNVPELPKEIRNLKARMQARARSNGRRFATIGIALDRLAADGIGHLEKFGPFNEIVAGHSWANRGVQHYIYGAGDMAGPAATPQVIVLSRRLRLQAGHVSIDNERVLVRKTGLDAISGWIAERSPISFDDG